MPNSTVTLQAAFDYVQTIGDLRAEIPVAGFSNLLCFGIGNDVMTDLISQRFNWKFNRFALNPFPTNSLQQDYASVGVVNIGWLESAAIVDINNTSLPKPIDWLEVVKDLPISSNQWGKPGQICWMVNDQLEQGAWPGANQTYTNPIGALVSPYNPPTNILDVHGNILILSQYGVTGGVAPDAGANPVFGTQINDGTCKWTVANPKAQGLRITPLPPQNGTTFLVKTWAQKMPPRFTAMNQVLDPLPDDHGKYFNDGVVAYLYRHSVAPETRKQFQSARQIWLQSIVAACKSDDKERDAAGFFPDRGIMAENYAVPVGPAWPYGPYGIG